MKKLKVLITYEGLKELMVGKSKIAYEWLEFTRVLFGGRYLSENTVEIDIDRSKVNEENVWRLEEIFYKGSDHLIQILESD